MPGWYKACEIDKSEQQVHLQLLLHLEFRGAVLAAAFLCPVCSIN